MATFKIVASVSFPFWAWWKRDMSKEEQFEVANNIAEKNGLKLVDYSFDTEKQTMEVIGSK